MPIRFRIDDRSDAVGFALSPLAELMLSLHVLLAPKVHALQHPWIRAMRTLPPALKREVRAFTPFYVDAVPDMFLPHGEDVSFEDELRALEELPLATFAYELARPLFHYSYAAGGRTDLGDPVVRERSLSFAGFYGAVKAGMVAVPLFAPELQGHAERLDTALSDARPAVILTTRAVADAVEAFLAQHAFTPRPELIVVDEIPDSASEAFTPVDLDVDDVSHLQYTSG